MIRALGGLALLMLTGCEPLQRWLVPASSSSPSIPASRPSILADGNLVPAEEELALQSNQALDVPLENSLPVKTAWIVDFAHLANTNAQSKANETIAVYRGEKAEVLQQDHNRLQLRLSDGSSGWLAAEHVVLAEAQLVTTVQSIKTFARPDLLSMQALRSLPAGSLLLVLGQVEQFSLVNWHNQQTTWVLTATLETTQQEIEAAKLLSRAKQLQLVHQEAAVNEILELTQNLWGHTRLWHYLHPPPPPIRSEVLPTTDTPPPSMPGLDLPLVP